jgi:hypothetical protein
LTIEDDCPNYTIKSFDATCGDLNIETKNIDKANILGNNPATDRVFFKSMSLVKMDSMSTVGARIESAKRKKRVQ